MMLWWSPISGKGSAFEPRWPQASDPRTRQSSGLREQHQQNEPPKNTTVERVESAAPAERAAKEHDSRAG